MKMNSKQKTILSIVDLSFDKFGSLELLLINLSEKLMDFNFKSVLVFNEEVPPQFKEKCKDFVTESLSSSRGKFYFYSQIVKLLFKYKPDIVHLGFYPTLSFMSVLIYLCGCHTIIITDHLSGGIANPIGIKRILVFWRNKCIIPFIKNITCVSNYVLERDKRIPGIDKNKLSLLYLGVSLDRFKPTTNNTASIRQELNIPQDAFVISTVAHLIKEKGIDYLIHAAKVITDKHENVRFLIVGKGKEEVALKTLTQNMNLDNKVLFLGLRNDSERILAISDIFVCPSIWQEAFGLTNIEAMACGVPVIATRVGGIPEIIAHHITGILIEPQDSHALENAIELLYSDTNFRQYLRQNALVKIKEHFDLNHTIKKTIAIYGLSDNY